MYAGIMVHLVYMQEKWQDVYHSTLIKPTKHENDFQTVIFQAWESYAGDHGLLTKRTINCSLFLSILVEPRDRI